MSETNTDYTKIERTRLREMVNELFKIRNRKPFTDWEYKFISNLKKWQGEFRPLQKQNLIRTYNKYFSEKNFGK